MGRLSRYFTPGALCSVPKKPLHPRLRLGILGTLGVRAKSPAATPSPGEEGFSLALALVIALVLILGAAALSNRSFFGLLGSAFQVQGREASSAAEIGATWAISRLNLEQNRQMLVTQDATNKASFEAPNTAWPSGAIPSTLCGNKSAPNTGTEGSLDSDPSTANVYEPWYIDNNGNVTATQPTGNYQSFRILGVRRPSQNGIETPGTLAAQKGGLRIYRNRDYANLLSSGTQPFYLQVEGSSFRNGVRVASTTLEQEFEVVPKCCGRSFGGSHGTDVYNLANKLPDEAAACVPTLALGQGILAGAGPGSGTVTLNGTPNFQTGTQTPIDPIFCLVDQTAGNQSTCSIPANPNPNQPTVSLIDGNLGLPQTYLQATTFNDPPLELQVCTNTSCLSNSTTTQSTINSDTTFTRRGSSGETIVNISTVSASNLPDNCSLTTNNNTSPPTETIHCNVTQFKPSSEVVFRTSENRRLSLYFPNPNTGSGNNASIIDFGGNTSVRNLRCNSSSPPTCSQPTLTDDPPYPVTTLSLFGCVTSGCGPQTIKMNGTPEQLFSRWWFPYGSVDLRGNSNIVGILWSENLIASGTPTFTVPGSGIGDVLCQLNAIGCNTNPTPTENPPFFDWLARATNRFQLRDLRSP